MSTVLQTALTLRMSEFISSLPLCAFVAFLGKCFPLFYVFSL